MTFDQFPSIHSASRVLSFYVRVVSLSRVLSAILKKRENPFGSIYAQLGVSPMMQGECLFTRDAVLSGKCRSVCYLFLLM